jgi:hypothetical protein
MEVLIPEVTTYKTTQHDNPESSHKLFTTEKKKTSNLQEKVFFTSCISNEYRKMSFHVKSMQQSYQTCKKTQITSQMSYKSFLLTIWACPCWCPCLLQDYFFTRASNCFGTPHNPKVLHSTNIQILLLSERLG